MTLNFCNNIKLPCILGIQSLEVSILLAMTLLVVGETESIIDHYEVQLLLLSFAYARNVYCAKVILVNRLIKGFLYV